MTIPGLKTPAYYTLWNGPYIGRWRVRAVKVEGGVDKSGPWTGWTSFSFKK
jgi:hypothetical protein